MNLASIMAVQPSVLILDEPTSQLDPIAASDFLSTLGKINRELGTTILLTEHRLEEAFPLATTVAVMDRGTLLCTGTPQEVGEQLRQSGHTMFLAMPTPMRIWAAVGDSAPCPVTVREGREWLTGFAGRKTIEPLGPEQSKQPCGDVVLQGRELWFKYDKDLPDVVKGLSLSLRKGEFLALLGGNGTGKTTSLKLLSGLRKPYRGELEISGSWGCCPRTPRPCSSKRRCGRTCTRSSGAENSSKNGRTSAQLM